MKYTCALKKMRFVIGERYDTLESYPVHFYTSSDQSLLYDNQRGDFSVLLGGDWRRELIVDSTTGKCIKIQSQLYNMPLKHSCLNVPFAERRAVYFKSDDKLSSLSGCHYFPFDDTAYFDPHNYILCFGNPLASGQAIEFSPNIIAVIDNENLNCIFMVLDKDKCKNIF